MLTLHHFYDACRMTFRQLIHHCKKDHNILSLNDFFLVCDNFHKNFEILVFQSETETGYVFKAFSKRWIRIIGRNKDKLIQEMRESKELMSLIQKSTKEELSSEEKEQVRTQFLDLIKTMPSLALFLLPGGSLLLPLILKLVPELMPSAFKVNEIEKKTTKNEV